MFLVCFIFSKSNQQIRTYPQRALGHKLLAGNRMNDGTVPFHADQDQNEDGRNVAERLHVLVHAAQDLAEHPAKCIRTQDNTNPAPPTHTQTHYLSLTYRSGTD